MVDWHRFTPSDFEYDFEQDKLAVHGVTFNENSRPNASYELSPVCLYDRNERSHEEETV